MTKFEYTGKNKTVFDLVPGDLVTLTGHIDDVSEVKETRPIGLKVSVTAHCGRTRVFPGTKLMRLYQ